jgi:hypothetical protein
MLIISTCIAINLNADSHTQKICQSALVVVPGGRVMVKERGMLKIERDRCSETE